MDIIKVYRPIFLKRVFLILSFLQFYNVLAQNDSLLNSKYERDYNMKIFREYYKTNPSLINLSNVQKFAFGNAMYNYGEGNLRAPQEYKKLNGFSLKTESINALDETNWTLYGKMAYSNTRNEEVETNLSYTIYGYNSPYYFFQKKIGLWNIQHYDLSFIGNNKISNNLTLGGEFDYKTNFYYRKIDTRNNQQSLKINAKLSASYRIAPSNIFSSTIGREYYKTESKLSNHYPENKTTEEYQIYLNAGLGSYLKSINSGAITKRNLNSLKFTWFLKGLQNKFLLSTYTKFGEEKWIDKDINAVTSNDVLTKYSIFKQNVSLNYIFSDNIKDINTQLSANYTKGVGNIWEPISKVYNQNFESKQYDIYSKSNLLLYHQLLQNIELVFNYQNLINKDYNYAYEFSNSFLTTGLKIGFLKNVNKEIELYLKPGGSYKYIIATKHNPFAAKNLYVNWIGEPFANYANINQYNLNNQLGLNLKLKKSILDIHFNLDYWKPTKTVYFSNDKKYNHYIYFGLDTTIYF